MNQKQRMEQALLTRRGQSHLLDILFIFLPAQAAIGKAATVQGSFKVQAPDMSLSHYQAEDATAWPTVAHPALSQLQQEQWTSQLCHLLKHKHTKQNKTKWKLKEHKMYLTNNLNL